MEPNYSMNGRSGPSHYIDIIVGISRSLGECAKTSSFPCLASYSATSKRATVTSSICWQAKLPR